MTEASGDTAGVIARPPLLYLGTLALGFGLDGVWPLRLGLAHWGLTGGSVLIAVAVVLLASSFLSFRRADTRVETWKPTTALVSEGPYRLSRNPIYVAFTLAYAGIGLIADRAWLFVVLPPLLIVMRYGVIGREEAYLERKFGAAYAAYKAQVRRWL